MFPLFSQTLPATAEEFARLLEASLRRIFDKPDQIVTLHAPAFPSVEELSVNLDHARVQTAEMRRASAEGESSPAFQLQNFQLQAKNLSVENISLDLTMRAHNARLDQSRDRNNEVVLVLQSADSGQIEIAIAKANLEELISTVAKREASKQGVAIENLKLSLDSLGERAVAARVELRARKLFFSGTIQITAKLGIDDALVALLSDLTCTGDGAVGSLACGFLRPHLQRLEGRRWNLAALPFGSIGFREVKIEADNRVVLTAQFGLPT
jgi:hypothetical protein